VPEPAAVLPGALPPELFFGRNDVLGRLRLDARALVLGNGRSRALIARAGSGKTELLRQWHGRLFGEGEVLPLWYPVLGDGRERAALAADLLAQIALQALAFKRRDPALLARTLPLREIAERLRVTWPAGGTLLAEAASSLETLPAGADPLALAAMLPHRLASQTGTPILCLLDDADNLSAVASLSGWPAEAAASPSAPLLLAFDEESSLARVFGPRDAAALVTVDRLAPLSADAASRLARHLARARGLALDEAATETLAREGAGSPFYLGALVRALAESAGSGPEAVLRATAATACDGETARYWIDRLSRAIPDRRIRAVALELLVYCLREGESAVDAGRLAALMLKPESEVEDALAALSRAGIVRVDCRRVALDADPVFREVVTALYRREFGSAAPAFIEAALAAEKIRRAPQARRDDRRRMVQAELRGLFERWNGQQVPAVLFDASRYQARLGGHPASEHVRLLADETERLTLPRVISMASGRVGGQSAPLGLEVDALAWALMPCAEGPETEAVWVVREIAGGAGGDDQLERFARDVAALQSAGDLPGECLTPWAILGAPLDPAGERCAARLRLLTSTVPQLEALGNILGGSVSFPPPVPLSPAPPAVELELVIPRVTDIELVAARALEQLAENLDVDAAEIGKLKMALVEACINAFEHGGERAGRVRVVLTAGAGRLSMRVENRGRPLAALPPPAAAGREAGGRGWGLTLIRELVDEVSLEPREDGVSLLMVKRLTRGGHG
jgi:anti-sigma regulatory factor (Ser/Thr protein kinase)